MTQDNQPTSIDLTLQDREDVLADVDIYLAYGMHDEAIAALERAIQNGHDRPEYRVRLVEAYAMAADGSAVQKNARLARTQLDPGDRSLLERIVAAEARFPGLEQDAEEGGSPAVTVPEPSGSGTPAGDSQLEAKSHEERTGMPADGDQGAGRAEDLAGARNEPDLIAPDPEERFHGLRPARWLRVLPWWIAALLAVSAIALVLPALPPAGFLDPARESEGSNGDDTRSLPTDPLESEAPPGSEQGTKPSEETAPNPVGTTIIVARVSFDPNSTMLDASFEPLLSDLAETLTDDPDTYAEVIGYTESSETIEYSEVLARQRAQAVTNRLIGLGVASHRVRASVQDAGEPVRAVSRPDESRVVEITVRTAASGQ